MQRERYNPHIDQTKLLTGEIRCKVCDAELKWDYKPLKELNRILKTFMKEHKPCYLLYIPKIDG